MLGLPRRLSAGVALTRERERLADAGTYGRRSTATSLLPGLLAEGFPLTL